MLDMKFIRENPDLVKTGVRNKNSDADIDKILQLDESKRRKQYEFDTLRARQNLVSKEVGLRKKENKPADDLFAETKTIAETLKAISAELAGIEEDLNSRLLWVPNVPRSDVPVGRDANDNEVVCVWGEERAFDFTPLDHLDIAEACGLLDLKRGSKITGSGFPVYTGQGAGLERALINFMLDFHIRNHGYTELWVPFMVNRKTLTGTGQLPKMENDMYRVDEEDLFLIPTAEVPVTNFHADEILPGDELPRKFVSYTPCFRREAGSYGKDTRGLQRVHQFNKVELVRITRPADSDSALEEMLVEASNILKALNIRYRILKLCTGDMTFSSAITYDIEAWSPGAGKWLEVSSVSNFRDFQARRASIRFRNTETGGVETAHTLNGSGLATPRTIITLLETWQNRDGSVTIPEPLRPYLGGADTIHLK